MVLAFADEIAHADVVDLVLTACGIIACLLALAAFLIDRGWRGWPKNRRPLCRRCNYLLEGLDKPKACPECGSDLTRRRAIRIGERRKRKRVLAIGFALLALVAGLCVLVAPEVSRIRWIEIEPVWMLRKQARNSLAALRTPPSPAPPTSSAALDELLRRRSRGFLSGANQQSLAAEALDIQGAGPWQPGWATFIEAAWFHNLLTDEQVQRYVRQGFAGMRVQVARGPRVREHQPLTLVLVWKDRLAQPGSFFGSMYTLGASVEVIDVRMNGQTVPLKEGSTMAGWLQNGLTFTRPTWSPDLAPGTYAGEITFRMEARWSHATGNRQRRGDPITTWTLTLPLSFVIAPYPDNAVSRPATQPQPHSQ